MLRRIGNTPVSQSVIGEMFPDIVGKSQKIRSLEHSGQVIRLKRGLYVVSKEVSGIDISTELIANHLYGPSYVSMLTALRFYGLIPEMVYATQSVTTKRARHFENAVGRFDYFSCPLDYFSIGLRHHDGFIIASPEKALCDLIMNQHGVVFRYKKEMLQYLEEDLRFEMDALRDLDADIIERCAQRGKKKQTLNLLKKMVMS